MPIVAEQYAFVIGVDTHAATHSLALVTAATGGIVTEAVFPNSPAGLDRALRWITGKINGESALIVIEGVGSYGAGLAQRAAAAGLLVAEPSPMPAAERRGVGKTDALDAVRIARSVLGVDTSGLRWPRATGQRVVLRVLSVAREEMVAERTRAINALTALLRTVDLGVDARKALPHRMFKVIAGWRKRREDTVIATCRQEAIRLAKRIVTLEAELADNRKALDAAVSDVAPELCELPGVGSVVAASVLMAWSHPGRVRSEAAFAALAGTCPIPASSGNTVRLRLNRGGDRPLEPCADHGGDRPHAYPRRDQGLCRTATRRGPHHQGDHAVAQALHHPTALPHPRRSTSRASKHLTRYRSICNSPVARTTEPTYRGKAVLPRAV